MLKQRFLLALFASWLLPTMFSGCGEQDEIRQYSAPKEIIAKKEQPGRRSAAWFLKMTGPAEQVEEQFLAFGQLTSRFRLDAEGKPSWDLPEGWMEVPPKDLDPKVAAARFATLRVKDSKPPLDVSITTLPAPDPTSEEYIQANFNRWRQQIGLAPVEDADWIAKARESKELAMFGTSSGFVAFVNLTGKTDEVPTKTVAAMIPYVPGGLAAPGLSEAPETPEPRPMAPSLKYDAPEGWTATTKPLASVAFTVKDGDKSVDTTVIRLGGGGDLLANVNRWRGQVGLAATTAEELKPESIDVGDEKAPFVELIGEEKTILAVIVVRGEAQWFIKLMGPKDIAAREREKFLGFVRSLRFE
jgi:hypothetical protein